MTEITRAEFGQAVMAAITTVHHLHRELAKLQKSLREALASDPNPIQQLLGPPRTTKDDSSGGVVGIRDSYSMLLRPLDEEVLDDTDTGEDDELEGDEESTSKNKAAPISFVASEPLYAVRILLRRPRSPEGFEPQLQFAILNDWAIGKELQKPKSDTPISLKRHMARRIPIVIDPQLSDTARKRVMTKALIAGRGRERRVSCAIATPVECRALFDLDGPEAIETLAADMKSLWEKTIGLPVST